MASPTTGSPSDDPTAAADPAASADPSRRAVVLENGQISLADLTDLTETDISAALSKAGAAAGRLVLEMLSPNEATKRLREHEQSFFVDRGRGVARYDVGQLASNNPIEDDHVERVVEVPEALVPPEERPEGVGRPDWMFWGVFDGHR